MLIRRDTKRRGMTIVESALVLSVFFLIFFGCFEYCRFLLVMHTASNAARDGARYAVVNIDKPTNFDTVDYNGLKNIEDYTKARMGGTDKQLNGIKFAVFAVDTESRNLTPPIIRPKTKSTATTKVYPDPFNDADVNKVPWNQASFTECVGVTIDGTYQPVLPVLMYMSSSFKVTVTSVANSEG